jgi:hypothetical protein
VSRCRGVEVGADVARPVVVGTVNVASDGGFSGTNEIKGLNAGQTVNETV